MPMTATRRAVESLAAIQAEPAITVAEIAQRLGIKQNYLHRVLATLQKKARKQGRRWHPA
jgi:DNA-binding IscR family transcriptional regulator